MAALVELSLLAWAPIATSCQQVLGPEIYPLLYPDWDARQRGEVEEACEPGSNASVFVADVGDHVAGFIAYTMNVADKTGEVELLAVHPDYQNRGIGTELNNAALAAMKAGGIKLVVVGTGGDPGHAPARRSYEKAGYTALPLVRYYQAL